MLYTGKCKRKILPTNVEFGKEDVWFGKGKEKWPNY
jgi:hypothetical protein